MKFIIALALFAVAFADEIQVVRLPEAPAPAIETRADIRQLIIPNELLEAIVVRQPVILRNAEVKDSIQVVDAPLDAGVEVVNAEDDSLVQFVDAPVDARVAPLKVDDAIRVRFADAPIEVVEDVAAEINDSFKVHFVDSPLEAAQPQESAPEAVKVAEIPELINLMPPRYPAKVYPDPRLR